MVNIPDMPALFAEMRRLGAVKAVRTYLNDDGTIKDGTPDDLAHDLRVFLSLDFEVPGGESMYPVIPLDDERKA
jgi:hypothetical protein